MDFEQKVLVNDFNSSFWSYCRDDWGRICTDVTAIDALVIHSHEKQFRSDLLKRELNKVSCLFHSNNYFQPPFNQRGKQFSFHLICLLQ